MSDAQDFQQRAAKLLALAITAREAGFEEYADQLVERAIECLNRARAASASDKSPSAEAPSPTQQEPPESDKDD